jgi:hypothetical protein
MDGSPAAESARRKRELLAELGRLATLGYGWDGRDALPPRADAMALARSVARDRSVSLAAMPTPLARAMADGTIELTFPGASDPRADDTRRAVRRLANAVPVPDLVVTFLCADHADLTHCARGGGVVESHACGRDAIVRAVAEHLDDVRAILDL